MFEDRLFTPKYFLGWIPTSIPLGIVLGSTLGGGFGGAVAGILSLCFTGLVFLGLAYLFNKSQGKTPVNWEIIWWCYPSCSMFLFIWKLLSAGGRFYR